MEKHVIETFGIVTKVETLHTIDHNVMPNTLVFENVEPFPGYYERTLPDDITPRSLFICMKKHYPLENILRGCQRIKQFACFTCDFTYALITINNTQYTTIRVKNIQNFSKLPSIQEALLKEEFELKHRKKFQAPGFIHISKAFFVEEMQDGIYKDLEEPDMFYIEIPESLNWSVFENITKQVKNNISNRGFDAALAVMYRKNRVVDLIRIYDRQINHQRASEIKSYYLSEIKRAFVQGKET